MTLFDRFRWLYLLANLLWFVAIMPIVILTGPAAVPLCVAASAGLVWLSWRRVQQYRYPPASLAWKVPEALALLVITIGTGDPFGADGLFYTGLIFHAFYGSGRHVLVVLCSYLGAYFGGVALLSGSTAGLEALTQVPGLMAITAMNDFIALVLAKHERALKREQILRVVGAALVAATDGTACIRQPWMQRCR